MFHHILVPLDGSPRAERAIPVATRLARASGGTVVLLRVVRLAPDFVPYPAADPRTIQTIIDADFEEAKNYLQRVRSLGSLMDVHTSSMRQCERKGGQHDQEADHTIGLRH